MPPPPPQPGPARLRLQRLFLVSLLNIALGLTQGKQWWKTFLCRLSVSFSILWTVFIFQNRSIYYKISIIALEFELFVNSDIAFRHNNIGEEEILSRLIYFSLFSFYMVFIKPLHIYHQLDISTSVAYEFEILLSSEKYLFTFYILWCVTGCSYSCLEWKHLVGVQSNLHLPHTGGCFSFHFIDSWAWNFEYRGKNVDLLHCCSSNDKLCVYCSFRLQKVYTWTNNTSCEEQLQKEEIKLERELNTFPACTRALLLKWRWCLLPLKFPDFFSNQAASRPQSCWKKKTLFNLNFKRYSAVEETSQKYWRSENKTEISVKSVRLVSEIKFLKIVFLKKGRTSCCKQYFLVSLEDKNLNFHYSTVSTSLK